jgi:hypothetical protein
VSYLISRRCLFISSLSSFNYFCVFWAVDPYSLGFCLLVFACPL